MVGDNTPSEFEPNDDFVVDGIGKDGVLTEGGGGGGGKGKLIEFNFGLEFILEIVLELKLE